MPYFPLLSDLGLQSRTDFEREKWGRKEFMVTTTISMAPWNVADTLVLPMKKLGASIQTLLFLGKH